MALLFFALFLLIFHSVIVLNAKSTGDAFYYILASWKEALLVVLMGWVVAKRVIGQQRWKQKGMLMGIALLLVYGIVLGLLNGSRMADVSIGARDFLLPLLVFVVVRNTDATLGRYCRLVNYFLVFFFSFHVAYSLYLQWTFDGNFQSIWFHSLFSNLERGVEFYDYNYIRDNQLRAFGLYVSPLEYSLSLLLPLFLLTHYLIQDRDCGTRLLQFLLLSLFLVAVYYSNVRTWVASYPLGLVSAYYAVRSGQGRFSRLVVFLLIPVLLAVVTFGYLILDIGLNRDPSALGRVEQYVTIPLLLEKHPFGFGFGEVGPKGTIAADSNLLTVFLAFGWAGGCLYIGILVRILFRLVDAAATPGELGGESMHRKVLFLSIVSYAMTVIYTSIFQYTLFYNIQYIFLVLTGLFLNERDRQRA